jgi:Flp pilus assembly pilin Flp
LKSSPQRDQGVAVAPARRNSAASVLTLYLRDTAGATSSEYALILGAICIGLLAVVVALGDAIGGAVTKVNNGFPAS